MAECWYEKIQAMEYSVFEIEGEKLVTDLQDDILSKYIIEGNEAKAAWEEKFIEDNVVFIDDETWKKFSKLKPKVKHEDSWCSVDSIEKFKGFNYNKKIKLDLDSWFKLKKVAGVVSFVQNIDSSRNNAIYLEFMKCIGICSKVRKCENWLKEIRRKSFIKMEANQLHHQTSQQHHCTNQTHSLQSLQEFCENTQLQYQEWKQQNHKPPEVWRTMKENIHITYRKPKGSNPWLLKKQGRRITIIRRSMQLIRDNITRLKVGSLFEEEDRQLLVFLEEEFYDLNSSNIRSVDKNYYVVGGYHHQAFLKEEHELAGNDGQSNHSTGSLKIIEKAVNFLRRKIDRFRLGKNFDELSESIKILSLHENEFGLQCEGNDYNVWKRRKKGIWKWYASFYKNWRLINTKLIINWKKKRRRINLVLKLIMLF
jgi:hypothetical protein